jgi:hypothetical protein
VDGSGRRPESRRPAPSLSSGATAEYDRSRQSTDPLVCPTRRQALSGQARQASGRLPASSSIVASAPAKTDSDRADRSPRSSAHRAAGATSEEAAPSGPMDRGHDADHKGPCRTAPSERPRPKPRAIATEPPRPGWQATADHAEPRGCRLRRATSTRSDTRESPRRRACHRQHAGNMTCRRSSPSASLRPDSPEKASRRIATSRRM